MIQFSARGAYLFLVPQGRALIFRTRRLFLSGETSKCSQQNLTWFLLTETVTVTNIR